MQEEISDLREKLINSRASCKSSEVDREILKERIEQLKSNLDDKVEEVRFKNNLKTMLTMYSTE